MTVRILTLLFLIAARASAQPLPEVLNRAGGQAERLADELASVKCTEKVTQARLDDNGKPKIRRASSFDYLIFITPKEDFFKVEESRIQQDNNERESAESFLVTAGFTTLGLIFHPRVYQNYTFEDLGPDSSPGPSRRKVGFSLKAGARGMAVLRLGSRNYPIAWEGEASIDEQTGNIYRIHARLQSQMRDSGLQSLETEVDYSPVKFADAAEAYWLPRTAWIDARTPRRHWRNTHEFANYRMFSVKTSTSEVRP